MRNRAGGEPQRKARSELAHKHVHSSPGDLCKVEAKHIVLNFVRVQDSLYCNIIFSCLVKSLLWMSLTAKGNLDPQRAQAYQTSNSQEFKQIWKKLNGFDDFMLFNSYIWATF